MLLAAAICVLFLDSAETQAQSEPGHVYTVRSHKVHPGKAGEYHKVYADVVRPVLDKLKADGDIVSYRDMVKVFGTQQTTHVLVVEYANYAALDGNGPKMEAASQAVLGKPFQEALGDLTLLREYTGTSIYESTQPMTDD